jgi:hypothetical protein
MTMTELAAVTFIGLLCSKVGSCGDLATLSAALFEERGAHHLNHIMASRTSLATTMMTAPSTQPASSRGGSNHTSGDHINSNDHIIDGKLTTAPPAQLTPPRGDSDYINGDLTISDDHIIHGGINDRTFNFPLSRCRGLGINDPSRIALQSASKNCA